MMVKKWKLHLSLAMCIHNKYDEKTHNLPIVWRKIEQNSENLNAICSLSILTVFVPSALRHTTSNF